MKLEWSSCIKPLLAAAYGNQDGISKLVHLIPLCKEELLNHADEHDAFYSSFTALCVHFIANHAPLVGRNKSASLADTFDILCNYVVKKMGQRLHASSIPPAQYSLLVKSLCTVSGCLNRSDIITLAAQMKTSALPDHVRGTMGADKVVEGDKLIGKGGSVSRELDPLGSVLTFVSGTVSDLPPSQPTKGKESKSPSLRAYQEQLANENTHRLIRLGIAQVLAELCSNMKTLNLITRNHIRTLKSGNALELPPVDDPESWRTVEEHLGSLLSEIEVIGWLTELRVWENLDASILERLSDLAGMVSLAAGLSLASRHCSGSEHSSARDRDSNAYLISRTVATKVSSNIRNILKHSSVSSQSAQNATTLESSAICGVLSMLIANCEMNVSLTEMSEHFLSTLSPILKETKKCFIAKKDKVKTFDVNSPLSSWQRLDFVGKDSGIIHALLSIASRSIQLAYSETLMEAKDEARDFVNDLFAMEEKRQKSTELNTTSPGPLSRAESGDSSSILGGWLEELLWSVPQLSEGTQSPGPLQSCPRRTSAAAEAAMTSGSIKNTFPDAPRVLRMASDFLRAIDATFMNANGSGNDLLKEFVRRSLTKGATGVLAEMVSLVDRNNSKLQTELRWNLSKLCHNMIASGAMDPKMEDYLLDQMLGVPLKGVAPWPFSLRSLRLALLGQILLLRQQREAEEVGRGETEAIVVGILERFVQTLHEAALRGVDSLKSEITDETYWDTDVSAEHYQLLLIVFQSLQRSGKFRVFATLRKAIVTLGDAIGAGEKGTTPHGGRLLLFFEYICRHFYEPAHLLPDQIQKNIFALSRGEEERCQELNVYGCPEVEEPFRIRLGTLMPEKPIFYHICSSPNEWLDSEKTPRLDNMAMNSLVEDPDAPQLYRALVKLQSVSPRTDPQSKFPFLEALELGSVQFLQSVLSRVLSFLPIPFSYFLEATKIKDTSLHSLHHTLRLAPRFQSLLYVSWQKEFFVKEKCPDYSESLLTELTTQLTSPRFNIQLCSIFFQKVMEECETREAAGIIGVTYPNLFRLHSVIHTLRVNSSPAMDTGNDTDNTEEHKAYRQLFNVLKMLHRVSKHLLISEAERWEATGEKDEWRLPSRPVCEALLGVASAVSPSNQPCLFEAGVLGRSFDEWLPPALAYAVSTWKRSEGTPEFMHNDSAKLESFEAEVHTSEILHGHFGFLLKDSPNPLLATTWWVLNSVQLLVCDVIARTPLGGPFCMGEVDELLVPQLYSIYLPGKTCEKIHCVLRDWHSLKDDQKMLFQKENAFFLEQIVGIILAAANEPYRDVFIPTLLDTLGKNSKRNITWPAWGTFSSLPSLGKELLEKESEILTRVEWIRLVGAIVENCVTSGEKNPCDPNMGKVMQELVIPLLLNRSLLEKWADALPRELASNTNGESCASGAVMDLFKSLNSFLTSPGCAQLCGSWGSECVNLLLEVSLLVVERVRFQPLDPVWPLPPGSETCSPSPPSDRWEDSLLTPSYVAIGSEGIPTWFNRLFRLSLSLAGLEDGRGLVTVAKSVRRWLRDCRHSLRTKTNLRLLEGSLRLDEKSEVASAVVLCDTTTTLCAFIASLLRLFRPENENQKTLFAGLDASLQDYDQEIPWAVEDLTQDEDDSGGEDSAEESSLDSKLCTFTVTQKEFMNQHWYHCHTCGMVDGEGVCSICAKVCHRDHDLSYSKFGSFFCDCGARQDGTCQALTRRSRSSSRKLDKGGDHSGQRRSRQSLTVAFDSEFPSTSKVSTASMRAELESGEGIVSALTSQLEGLSLGFPLNKSKVSSSVLAEIAVELSRAGRGNLCQELLTLISTVLPAITAGAAARSASSAISRQKNFIAKASVTLDTKVEHSELLIPRMSSQETLIENAKPNFSGDQGKNIRQLIQSRILHKVSLGTLTFPEKAKQYLVVAHDRNKLTVHPLGPILKQIDHRKIPMTSNRAAHESLPFTTVSMSIYQEFVAVTGLKECQVFVMASSGAVSDKLGIHPSLEGGNFIIKAKWIHGQRGLLALVTADFVNIYDLKEDLHDPQHQFLLPAGKIRDVSFAMWEKEGELHRFILIFSSMGHLYMQEIEESSRFGLHGSFFVTSSVPVQHPELDELGASGHVGGGGLSLHYSHALQLLFLSYTQGKSFVALLTGPTENIASCLMLYGNSGPGKEFSVYNWSENKEIPGLILGRSHSTAGPVLIYFAPRAVKIQDSFQSEGPDGKMSKTSIIDSVMLDKDGGIELINLGEDGGLHFLRCHEECPLDYLRSSQNHGFNPAITHHAPKRRTRRKAASKSQSTVVHPVDLFEGCQPINEVEFGGADLLQIYSPAHLKARLNTSGQYIACSKASGFELEVNLKDPQMIVCGLRLELGKYAVDRSPAYIEMFGWRKDLRLVRARWFDIPLSHAESITALNPFSIKFGPSMDNGNSATIVDSVKLYGKSKEAFGWVEEDEEERTSDKIRREGQRDELSNHDRSGVCAALPSPLIPERLLSSAFESLEAYFSAFPNGNDRPKSAVDLASGVLCTNLHLTLVERAKSLLRRMSSSISEYHVNKDRFLLSFVWNSFPVVEQKRDSALLASLLSITRNIARRRPENLVLCSAEVATSKTDEKKVVGEERAWKESGEELLRVMVRMFWLLLESKPRWAEIAPIGSHYPFNAPAFVSCIVEIFHGYCLVNPEFLSYASEVYSNFLLSENLAVGQACRQTLAHIFKTSQKKKKGADSSSSERPMSVSTPASGRTAPPLSEEVSEQIDAANNEANEEADLLFEEDEPAPGGMDHLEAALLAVAEGSGEEEAAMMELAIALSLQDHPEVADAEGDQAPNHPPPPPPQEAVAEIALFDSGPHSDASGLSEEEGSTVATDGSTIRISPAEERIPETPGSGAASESGASGNDSGGNDTGAIVERRASEPGRSLVGEKQETKDSREKLTSLRAALLQDLLSSLSAVSTGEIPGAQMVAYMQTLLILASDLSEQEAESRELIKILLDRILDGMNLADVSDTDIATRTRGGEILLLKLRLLSVLLTQSKKRGSSSRGDRGANEYLATKTAFKLDEVGIIEFCRRALSVLVGFWKEMDQTKKVSKSKVLVTKDAAPLLDLSPFFLRQYVKEHSDVFEQYTQLMTEMALRLPYQVRKVKDYYGDGPLIVFSSEWDSLLCQFVSCQETPFVRRQARKLLLLISGSKDNYRFLRDQYNVHHQIDQLQKLWSSCVARSGKSESIDSGRPLGLSHAEQTQLMEQLKATLEIAHSRPHNWQKLCLRTKDMETPIIPFLFKLSIVVNDVVGQVVLELILTCFASAEPDSTSGKGSHRSGRSSKSSSQAEKETGTKGGNQTAKLLTSAILAENMGPLLLSFLRRFLLQTNVSGRRWQVHELVQKLFAHGSSKEQHFLLGLFRDRLWPDSRQHGSKASLLIDILGYYTVKLSTDEELEKAATELLQNLEEETKALFSHPNAATYNVLGTFLDCDGYFLEDNPCLVCNNPEVPITNLKLNALKVDSRFTTASQVVKLSGSHEIAKVIIKFSDIKRSKMVKQLRISYSNKGVGSAVELKNKPELWSAAKDASLVSGQTEIKLDFPVPIVACNFKLEFTEFFESQKSGSELLHCPRCSASVPANPGVCGNCGENVFQCHKCRSINYDEKDPFLCNSCGFSKYAKFEVHFMARQVPGVEPIENAEDRKKTVGHINNLLEKAEHSHKQLLLLRASIESSIAKLNGPAKFYHETGGEGGEGGVRTGNGTVNKIIQDIASKYCRDARTAFDDLSRSIQQLLANRAELLQYDAREGHRVASTATLSANLAQSSTDCFGCTTSLSLHCIALLRAYATSPAVRRVLSSRPQLIHQLLAYTREAPPKLSSKVQELLGELCRDSPDASQVVCQSILDSIQSALTGDRSVYDLGPVVQHELQLLRVSLSMTDSCWETRLRCAFKLLVLSLQWKKDVAMEQIALPVLQMLHTILLPPTPSPSPSQPPPAPFPPTQLNFKHWLLSTPFPPTTSQGNLKGGLNGLFLMHKFGLRWLLKIRKKSGRHVGSDRMSWLERALFCGSSLHTRRAASAIFQQISMSSFENRVNILDMITKYVFRLSLYGERASEFLALFKCLIQEDQWKCYLAVRQFLPQLGTLIGEEVSRLEGLEESSFTIDITLGYSIRIFAELLQEFFAVEGIRSRWKGSLLGPVLHGYLALRLLVVQRTKLIDEAQGRLLELLEDLTTGTEAERRNFMATCIETVEKYPLDDMRTPVFVFERLCSIVFPEEKEVGEFLINIEKDPAQEDFLQGRMMGNPYSSSDNGMGPLMKDLKNRICRDCELIALLEDDTGMELLVGGKIISLDIPVGEVYRKLWLPQHPADPMNVVYRMRGLLGDATEEFVESLDLNKQDSVDEEETYRMANVMATSGGLKAMLQRLQAMEALSQGRALLAVILKLFRFCIKVRLNREALMDPSLKAVSILLGALKLILSERDAETFGYAVSLLDILLVLFTQSQGLEPAKLKAFYGSLCSKEDLEWLLSLTGDSEIMAAPALREKIMEVAPNLTFGSPEKMNALVAHFAPCMDFNEYDCEPTPERRVLMECFCLITKGIPPTSSGGELKQKISKAASNAAEYLCLHCPPLFKVGSGVDSPEWKDYLSKRGLKYALRILSGLCQNHEPSQMLVANSGDCIMIVHRLEQLSTEEHLGSLAENLMEALRGSPKVKEKIEQVRKETRNRKKQMAMAVRKMHLQEIGVEAKEEGLKLVSKRKVKEAEELEEETGLTCSICREGYRSQPHKVLAVYTFTKRVNAEEFEIGARKTPGYSTVSHFNVIHVDCHISAVRSAQGREEWESAVLHNTNTRCNGLLPLWGPNVPESNFANCLARHQMYIQELSGINEITIKHGFHDLKALLRKFAAEESFSEDSGGGGKESNIQLVPCFIALNLYVLIASKIIPAELKLLNAFISAPSTEWVSSAYAVEGPAYYCALALTLMPPTQWKEQRLYFLKRLVITAQARAIAPQGSPGRVSKTVQDYSAYKTYLIFWALVDRLSQSLFRGIEVPKSPEEWPMKLQSFIKESDTAMLERAKEVLQYLEEDLLPCASLDEFLDVAGLLSTWSTGTELLSHCTEGI